MVSVQLAVFSSQCLVERILSFELAKIKKQGFNNIALKGNQEEMMFDSIELEYWINEAEET